MNSEYQIIKYKENQSESSLVTSSITQRSTCIGVYVSCKIRSRGPHQLWYNYSFSSIYYECSSRSHKRHVTKKQSLFLYLSGFLDCKLNSYIKRGWICNFLFSTLPFTYERFFYFMFDEFQFESTTRKVFYRRDFL